MRFKPGLYGVDGRFMSGFSSLSHRFDENIRPEQSRNPRKTSREADIPVTTVIFPSRGENVHFSQPFGIFGINPGVSSGL